MSDRVATTQWSLVVAARDGAGTEARSALERLCASYWQPLYAFVRHQGHDPEEARDLTQAYFTELLEKDFLAGVDAARGRFRSFLFASMRHFLSHQRERAAALKRGGGATMLPLDLAGAEASYQAHAGEVATPEAAFERRWAMTALSRAMDRLRDEEASAGRSRQYEFLRPYLTSFEPHLPYREVAVDLDVSEGAVKVAVHRLRQRFARCLRSELADTLADPADIHDELRRLLTVLRR